MSRIHSVHIPVMGTAFSIDTPLKVAKYGIASVISLVDDTLIEEMRKFYSEKTGAPYTAITKYEEDFRAKRITAYLNLVDQIVKADFKKIQDSAFEPGSEIIKYFDHLPENSPIKKDYIEMLNTADSTKKLELQKKLRARMKPGSIDVNIMTKLDRVNFDSKRNELPSEFSDALAALRGYAQSQLHSAIVFSAGINRRLYSYAEKFKDFYADASGVIKKKIILKVSDYRSSIIQGRFFAKKGLWVSEYRIESGLNCGGHAFASDGFLMGPILDEFRKKKNELVSSIQKLYNETLTKKKMPTFAKPHETKITAQGGIGTSKENQFLLNFYKIDGTGWATPFLLVPEVTNVDAPTLEKLSLAKEDDLYLSGVSPLGVPFNNIKGNSSDAEKDARAKAGKPGSACPKGHLVSNTEFTEIPICTASRQYQKLKVEQLQEKKFSKETFQAYYEEITKKSCLCHDLGEAALIKNSIENKNSKHFVAVCPGPNLAYFSKISTLSEMLGHIYGRLNLLNDTYRPNMFIKELKMYVDYFIQEVQKSVEPNDKQIAYLNEFRSNMLDGIKYYKELFPTMIEETENYKQRCLFELEMFNQKIDDFVEKHAAIFKQSLPELATA